MHEYKADRKVRLEILVVVSIAILIIVLIHVMGTKINELIVSDAEVLFADIDHDPTDEMHKELATKISEFRPGVYKMIEIYDADLNEVMTVKFDDAEDDIDTDIKKYPDLAQLMSNNEDGHTSRTVDDSTEYIYFKWSRNDDGEPYLFIIYTYKPMVRYLWVIKLICYLILVLVCTLLMMLSLKNKSEKIRYYSDLQDMHL